MKQLRAVVYSGKVGARTRAKRHTISKRVIKGPHQCKDGPWKGRILYLESDHTLVMNIGGMTGRYVNGKWEECK